MSLLSASLTLRPLGPEPPVLPCAAAGRILLAALDDFDPTVATQARMPGPAGVPYTISCLDGLAEAPSGSRTLRVTALAGPVSDGLAHAIAEGPLSVGRELNLGAAPFLVEDTQLDRVDYHSLAAPWLSGVERPPARFAVRFTSPTTFLRGAHPLPMPLPDLLFGDLLQRWNAFAPISLPVEVRSYVEQCLQVAGYRLATRHLLPGDGGLLGGAVGVVRYAALRPDTYLLSLCALLLRFAAYAGAGMATELGMGQCHPEP